MAKGKRGGSRTNVGGKIVCKLPSNLCVCTEDNIVCGGSVQRGERSHYGMVKCVAGVWCWNSGATNHDFPLELTIQSFISNECSCAVVVTGETLFKTAPACVVFLRQGCRRFSQLPPQRKLHDLDFIYSFMLLWHRLLMEPPDSS